MLWTDNLPADKLFHLSVTKPGWSIMKSRLPLLIVLLILSTNFNAHALSSNNIPLGSPAYSHLDKLAAFGLITSDFAGIRPITKAEAARLVREAEKSVAVGAKGQLAQTILAELKYYLRRELSLYETPAAAPAFDLRPVSEAAARFVFLEGAARNYERPVRDLGGEGVFGIGAGLRPIVPNISMQHGSEGTPLFENNEGTRYPDGSSLDVRLSSEIHVGEFFSLLVEPQFISVPGELQVRFNKGYLKVGGGWLELEVGRDANWLGFGERGALTLSNNASNFDQLKLSSPEPLNAGFMGKFKYTVIFSRFDKVYTADGERQPWFYAIKGSLKPHPTFEVGINLGRQQGGPGVDNSLRDNLQGLVGGTGKDNSNSIAGVELRWRMSFLRNTEVFVEYSGEDAAKFWPIVESYLAGIYVPRLTDDGKNDFRFEYFLGNNILYTHTGFSEGYIYRGMPIGHSQGGAAQDFFFRYGHWFSARERVTVDYIHTSRGNTGRLAGQSLESKNAVRGSWLMPLSDRLDIKATCGWERINNLNLVGGTDRTNSIAVIEAMFRF